MQKKISRRHLLKAGLILSGAALTSCAKRATEVVEKMVPVAGLAPTSGVYIPLVKNEVPAATATPVPTQKPTVVRTPQTPGNEPRVVLVHAQEATSWNMSAQDYWNYVNQAAVDSMVDEGMLSLTGKGTLAEAWHSLIPNYKSGQVVAIKVSFNNTDNVDGYSAGGPVMIDGIIEPVNAIIRGLKAAGVDYPSIVVYDSSRVLPTRFTSKCLYPGVQFKDGRHDPWGSTRVTFQPPDVQSFTQSLSMVAAEAAYLINVPILKIHSMARLSLGMKNHYGSIQDPEALHDWTSTGDDTRFTTLYSPIVDLNKDPNIADKTILTVGDGIFAAFHNWSRSFPQAWITFNNQTPKSLFFSTDPVAIDCVMGDIMNAERVAMGKGAVDPKGFAYMQLAADAGLGVFERGAPWGSGYTKIDYQKLEI